MSQDGAQAGYDVVVPRLHGNAAYYKIVAWLREEGDLVRQGDSLLILETDKAEIGVEAEASGVLQRILFASGEWIRVDETVAIIVPGT